MTSPPPNPFAPWLRWLAYLLAPYIAEYIPRTPPRPGHPRAWLIGQEQYMLKIGVSAPPPINPADVALHMLRVVKGGVEQASVELPREPFEVTRYDGATLLVNAIILAEHGDILALSVVDTDAAGNSSESAVLEFTVTDVIPPAVPGAPTAQVVGEE